MPSSSDGNSEAGPQDKGTAPEMGKQDDYAQNSTTYWLSNVPGQAETPESGLRLLEERYRIIMGGLEMGLNEERLTEEKNPNDEKADKA